MDTTRMRVLVTAVGTVNGSTVVEELRKNNIYTIGANSTPKEYVVASKYVDEYYEFPSAVEDRKSYLEYVLKFCDDHGVTHIICFIDEEVESFTANRSLFEQHGIVLCLPDHDTVHLCHYKDRFSEWIERNYPGISIKRYDRQNVDDSVLPVFVKPFEGRAGNGCRIIQNGPEWEAFLSGTQNAEGYLIQQLVQGYVVGVDIIRNRKYDQIMTVQKKELSRNSNGCGIVVEIIDDKELEKICISLAEKLDLNGLVNVEFFITEEGPKIIEINPRLPAGTSYSCLAGADTVINTIRIADGEPCEFGEIGIGKIYARRYETYEM